MKALRKITRTGRGVGRYFYEGHVTLLPFVSPKPSRSPPSRDCPWCMASCAPAWPH
ncbi:MAG: hypothetical protein MUC40_07545 [Akkermansiaceae bacterium]|nr:hypothetical protein [Akkermansiaceae bacterium]